MEYDFYVTDEHGYPVPPEFPDWVITAVCAIVPLIMFVLR